MGAISLAPSTTPKKQIIMIPKNSSIFVLGAGMIASAHAVSIVLVDGSFETSQLEQVDADSAWKQPASGWYTYNSSKAASGIETNNDGFWNIPSTHGNNSAYATSSSSTDGGSIYQNVSLSAGSYSWTVAVGSSTGAAKQDGLFSLNVYQSTGGGTGLVLVAETAVETIAFGTDFTDYTLNFSIDTDGTYAVGVRNRGYVADSQPDNPAESTVFFDNARLNSVSAVPEPSSTALLGLGGLALILRRRK